MEQIPQSKTPPTTPMPLQLSGYLNGDTIEVEGDTGNLQFSVKFNIHRNNSLPNNHNDSNFPFPSLNSLESKEDSSFSSYQTPKSLDLDALSHENHGVEIESNEVESDTTKRETVMTTRLKSGAISKVNHYFPRISRENYSSCRRTTKQKRKINREREEDNVFDKLLRRRTCPVKPCNSYVFFVMSSWGSVKSSSFGETSKRLSQMWCKLPRKHKKMYEDIALKDSARYKTQSMLLNCEEHDDLSANRNNSVDVLRQGLKDCRQAA